VRRRQRVRRASRSAEAWKAPLGVPGDSLTLGMQGSRMAEAKVMQGVEERMSAVLAGHVKGRARVLSWLRSKSGSAARDAPSAFVRWLDRVGQVLGGLCSVRRTGRAGTRIPPGDLRRPPQRIIPRRRRGHPSERVGCASERDARGGPTPQPKVEKGGDRSCGERSCGDLPVTRTFCSGAAVPHGDVLAAMSGPA